MSSNPTAYTEAWLRGPADHPFYTRTYLPPDSSAPRAAVLFIHGFAEHVGRHEHAHRVWAQRGLAVVTFDQRGFGRTALSKHEGWRGETYGKTSHREQIEDIEWFVRYVGKRWEGTPVFLAGQSMGGALALSFPTQARAPPDPSTTARLAGVLACSPLLRQTAPVPRLMRRVGGAAANVLPWMAFPAVVPVEDLSHDSAMNEATDHDPLIRKQGTLRGLADMFNRGEDVVERGYRRWPRELPVLVIHGTADKVTSPQASQEFVEKLDASDKKLSLIEGGFHELTHEPDGVKERFWDECVKWILAHANAGGAPVSRL